MNIDGYKDVQKACRFCNMCRHVCTVANHTFSESDTPRAKGLLLQSIERGLQNIDMELADTLYQCCLCGYCKQWCVSKYDVPELVKAARRDLVANDMIPDQIRSLADNIMASESSFGEKNSVKGNGMRSETLLYLGRTARFDRKETAQAAISVLNKLGIEFTVLDDENDSGFLLCQLGYENEGISNAKSLAGQLADYETVIVLNSTDYHWLNECISKHEINIKAKVVHFIQYILDLLKEKSPKIVKDRRAIAFHDAAYGVRFSDIGKESESLIKMLVDKQIILNWSGKLAHSAGEGLILTHPEISKDIAKTRLSEVVECGAEIVVTADPECKASLLRAADGFKVNIMDISELVDSVL